MAGRQPGGSGEYYFAGMTVPVRWDAPSWGGQMTYAVQISVNGGATWTEIASGLTGTSFDWIADSSVSSTARVRVLAFDDTQLLLGYDDSEGRFILGGTALTPPRPVEGKGMTVELSAGVTTIFGEWPMADMSYGPATEFKILTTDKRGGTFDVVAVVGGAEYVDASGDPPLGGVLFYKIVASNAAGDAQ